MRKPSLHEEQDNPRWRTRFLHPREHPPLRVNGIGEHVHGVWADTMNSRIWRLRAGAGSQSCMPNPRTHALTHLPTYPHTTARKQTARELHANCVRARAPMKAKTKKKANSNVNAKARAERRSRRRLRQRLARWPPAVSRWSLAANRCLQPAAKMKMTMSCVQSLGRFRPGWTRK